MIRYSLLSMVIGFICLLGIKDWYKALCLLIPLQAVLERPDMPRSIMGITGLNAYNLALACILAGWILDKRPKERLNIPRGVKFLAAFYFVMLVTAALRMMADMSGLHELLDYIKAPHPSTANLVVDHLINPIRFALPGFLLAAGAKERTDTIWAAGSFLAMGTLLALQIIAKMIPALLGADDLADRALRVLQRDIGYHRVAASTIMSMISAGFFAALLVKKEFKLKLIALGGFMMSSLALALTGGRAGLAAWAVACGIMGLLRQRTYTLIGGVLIVFSVPFIPGLQDRISEGFNSEEGEHEGRVDMVDSDGRDLYAITSGRALVWPIVIDEIRKSPLIGHGKEAMKRQGITLGLTDILGADRTDFGHPHNAYLELILDNGLIGAIPILLFYGLMGIWSMRAFLNREDEDLALVGGMTFAFLLAFAIANLGSGSFYPQLRTSILFGLMGLFIGIWFRSAETPAVASEAETEPAARATRARMIKPLWHKASGS